MVTGHGCPDRLGSFMRLVHFSKSNTLDLRSADQPTAPHMKPNGLWVSVESADDAWSKWCEAEDWGLGSHEFTIEPTTDANILYLRTAADIQAFTTQFSIKLEGCKFAMFIDWIAVANKYDGIIITPYQWSMRMNSDASWYYGWDCASGCIWNASAMKVETHIRRAA